MDAACIFTQRAHIHANRHAHALITHLGGLRGGEGDKGGGHLWIEIELGRGDAFIQLRQLAGQITPL